MLDVYIFLCMHKNYVCICIVFDTSIYIMFDMFAYVYIYT